MLGPANEDQNSDRADQGPIGAAPFKTPFGGAEIARLFRSWEDARGILLAVSGGPDSVALMLLAAAWAESRAAPPLRVATVDHCLREGSRHEAEQVGAWAAALGLPHEILVWDGAKQRSRIQERARQARYDLLFAHAARIGADIVATAHHADDQAETILFRLLRGSGLAGLAGMTGSRERSGLTHSRPLLHRSKAELLAFCEARAHPSLDDPSNRNPAYARTRMRALSGFFAAQGLDGAALLRLGRRAARAEAALAEQARFLRAGLEAERKPGLFRANIASLAAQPEEALLRILSLEIQAIEAQALDDVGPPLRLDRLEALTLALRKALQSGVSFASTLGGAALRLRADGTLTIQREKARRRGLTGPKKPPSDAI
ncbi:tRNA lysidine(34) synthetase TilS [Methylocapsa aurea]|uniref:tRNA lysidine(34) synthetase TilS n=1 Tax=Methylocapsa aurea TaxID=663610 RepID=UPI00056161AB|nr:tRNA lysidine(34) synthetase TilS [Methylocapsa aurea]